MEFEDSSLLGLLHIFRKMRNNNILIIAQLWEAKPIIAIYWNVLFNQDTSKLAILKRRRVELVN